jgi:hypothetical protein
VELYQSKYSDAVLSPGALVDHGSVGGLR